LKYWLIIHQHSNYLLHNDLIGIPAKLDGDTGQVIRDEEGNLTPRYFFTNEIEIGDKVAYYCPTPKRYIIGLFKIIEGPGFFTSDWDKSIQFKIEPLYNVVDEIYISYYDLLERLEFFKDDIGQPVSSRAAAAKIYGTIKKISENDFRKVEEMYINKIQEVSSELRHSEGSPSEISFHNSMIRTTHLQAKTFLCSSFIGSQERNAVNNSLSEEDEQRVDFMAELPSWVEEIGKTIGTYGRLRYIDNLWFIQESKGYYIPFCAIEHEKDGNLEKVMNHFQSLDDTLKSNPRFESIEPLYIIVAKDDNQARSYKRRISDHGKWKNYSEIHRLAIFSIDEVKQKIDEYIELISEQLNRTPRFD